LSSPAPVPTPTSRSGDNTSARSLLPIRVNGAVHSPQARTERRNLHKRSITEYNESVGSIPPKVSFAAEPVVLENLESDNTLSKCMPIFAAHQDLTRYAVSLRCRVG
jgi:hypothetical protein